MVYAKKDKTKHVNKSPYSYHHIDPYFDADNKKIHATMMYPDQQCLLIHFTIQRGVVINHFIVTLYQGL